MDHFDFSASGFSSGSGSSNPFAGPSVAVIRDIPIAEHVPVKLSTTAANFFPWKTYFGLLFREYDLLDHVDGTIDLLAMPHDPEWLAIDATIIRWFYQTISNDIFRTVVHDGDSVHTVWAKITGLFTDNRIQWVTFLQQEFFGTHQNDLSLDDYALKRKSLSDELRDLEFPIDDKIMLSTLSAGLGEDLSNAASNLTFLTTPTFEQAVAYLRLEERRLKHLRARAADTAFIAGFSRDAQAGPTGSWIGHAGAQAGQTGPWTGQTAPSGGGRRGRRRRGGGGNGGGNAGANASAPRPPQHTAPPPWTAGHNPWTGVIHAYFMPVPRAPYPGIMGPCPATHQAFYAAPQPAPAYAAPPGATPWDPALLNALQSAPSAGAYGGGGDWFMDTGASTHMAAHPGNLSFSTPASSSSRIIVGNGHALSITHTGSVSFPSTSTPLSLHNVLVSPDLIKNLVSVKSFCRENPVTVEFDAFGFSVKDGRTRMLLHRCDSPGDLYPVGTASTTTGRPLVLSAGVDLWHARLGHPSSATLRQIMQGFSFTCNKTDAHSCEACRLGKHVRLPFSSSSTVASFPFQLIHSDVWTSPVLSNSGYNYYLVILDDYSHFVWTFPLRRKSDVAATLIAFFAFVSTQFGHPIHALQTDNGKEFDNITIRSLLATHGVVFRLTCPYTSSQNGRAERMLRTLNDCVPTLLFHASMPPRFWPDALATTTLLVNIRP
ncbi:uncharacterized protein [Lolium perenne]|uniref:uncharacterized protein n=1 Tax=Lolium perenne TaxID=4522 RepID=UPI003A9A0249